jgi:hypothetical protein
VKGSNLVSGSSFETFDSNFILSIAKLKRFEDLSVTPARKNDFILYKKVLFNPPIFLWNSVESAF